MDKNNLKTLKNLATTKKYNKKGNDGKKNGSDQNTKYINVNTAKVMVSRWPSDPTHQLLMGGEDTRRMLKKGIERARSQEEVHPVEPPKPSSNSSLKPAELKTKDVEVPNGKISYVTAESKNNNKRTVYITEEQIFLLNGKQKNSKEANLS